MALGAVIRGETSHYDIVAFESARALMDLTVRGIAMGNGVLACENAEQAWARAQVDGMNKGGHAAGSSLAHGGDCRQRCVESRGTDMPAGAPRGGRG